MESPETSEMVGVILAAGKGSRMSQLPTQLPKPVLPILGRPIIHHQLEMMAKLGIKKAIVVVGYRGFEIVHMIERLPDTGVSIEYVEQEETLGIAHCLGRLEGIIDSSFILFLGDIYFHAPDIHALLEEFAKPGVQGVLGAIHEEDKTIIAKNFCILCDDDGRATRVIEKPRYPSSNLKGVGVYVFDQVVFDAIRRTPKTAMRNEYEITESIQIMIDDGRHVRPCACIEADLNVTDPKDLLAVNLKVLNYQNLENFIGDNAVVPTDAILEKAVIGEGAVVGAGATIKNTIVFPGATVPDGMALENAVVTEIEILRV